MEVPVFSPAKINLFLAVIGRRADGFHDLLSVAAPLDFGDDLVVRRGEAGGERFTLECDRPDVPVDGSNLILRAAEAFAAVTGWKEAVHFRLTKRIPVGAGLGGGSSNAVATLRALNALAGEPLGSEQLSKLAAELGSDCALFLRGAPVAMRGRGERVVDLTDDVRARLRGQRLVLFKPGFGIATPWAYQRMISRGGDYLPAVEAERRFEQWAGAGGGADGLLFNNMEPAAFEKYPALPLLLDRVRRECGVTAAMSGSGSACFALLPRNAAAALVADVKRVVRDAWGERAFVQEASVA